MNSRLTPKPGLSEIKRKKNAAHCAAFFVGCSIVGAVDHGNFLLGPAYLLVYELLF